MNEATRRTLIPGEYRILHGGDYNPDQWLHQPEIIEEDFRLMRLAGCHTFSVGIFAWAALEPEEGRYTFEWLDRIMDRMAEEGHRVILATPSGSKPAWLSYAYPEIRRVTRDGQRELHHGRHNHCWSSPVYRRKVREINTRLAERYARHPALGMWHVSNEYNGACYCDLCLEQFRRWLRERYGSLDALNQAWWTAFWSHTFTDWSQVDPRDGSIDGATVDWLRFNTWQIADFYRWEIEPLKAAAPEIPCTTNFMAGDGRMDYARLAEVVDIVADDQYPCYDAESPGLVGLAWDFSFRHDLLRAARPDRPWMLMESCPDTPQWKYPPRPKQPGLHRAEMLQALGAGAEGTCYFQWRKGRGGIEKLHGAVVDHAGHEHTRVFQTVAEIGRLYPLLQPIIGSEHPADVALLYDWEVKWAFECSLGVANRDQAYRQVALMHHRALRETGAAVDVLHSERDWRAYRLLIAPQLWLLKPGVAQRLRAFVEAGGTLVATHYTGCCDDSNRCFLGGFPGEGLQEVFGLWNEETDVLPQGATEPIAFSARSPFAAGEVVQAGPVCAIVHLRGAEPLATYADRFYRDTPAVTVRSLGRGRAFYLAAQLPLDGLRRLYRHLVEDLGLTRAVAAPLPEGVLAQRRIKGDRVWLFLQNFTPEPRSVALHPGEWRSVETGSIYVGTLTLVGFESTVLECRAAR